MDVDGAELLPEQLDWQWREHLRPRFEGLGDEEYFWEPVRRLLEYPARGAGPRRDRGQATVPSASTLPVQSRARRR